MPAARLCPRDDADARLGSLAMAPAAKKAKPPVGIVGQMLYEGDNALPFKVRDGRARRRSLWQFTTVVPPLGGLNPKNANSQYLKSDAQLWPARRVPEVESDRLRTEKRRRLLPTDEATGVVVEPVNRSKLDVR